MTNPENTMQLGTWVLVVILALAIGVPVALIGVRLWLARIKWRVVQLPGYAFKLAGSVSDAAAAAALLHALEALRGVWPGVVLPNDLRIFVMDTESWLNSGGQHVGGEQEDATLRVSHSLSSLCHELAHLFEARIDLVRDDAHAGWASKRIWDADNEYRSFFPDRNAP